MADPGALSVALKSSSVAAAEGRLPAANIWRRLRTRRYAIIVGALAALLVLLALIVPVLPLQDPVAINYDHGM